MSYFASIKETLSSCWKRIYTPKSPSVPILMLGLDAAGKTTILYKLKHEVVTTIPTIGFNVETVELSGAQLTCWDVGGCDKIRPVWRHFIKDARGFVFVVDSHDIDRLDSARNELEIFLNEEYLNNCPLLRIHSICE